MIKSIDSFCDTFLLKKIDLVGLQQNVEAVSTNFEGDVDLELRKKVHNFIAELEIIRFMYEDSEQFEQVKREITNLKKALSQYL